MVKPNYGNWTPQKLLGYMLLASVSLYFISSLFDYQILYILLNFGSFLLSIFFIYLVYVYWLLEKDDKKLQRQFWSVLVDKLDWDGNGKALDVGTGNGPVAIMIAKKYPSSKVLGIDFWGRPWTYSKEKCERNAEIEQVSDRVSFQKASAVNLPFSEGEFDAVLSNFVYHAIKLQDRTKLIAETLRVLRKGGVFAIQDLFNDEFYDKDFLEVVKNWELHEVNFIESSEFIQVPLALKTKHMTGGSGILFGVK
jgi:SAM-dependent methyltransferase